jgi:hypothetical protein
MMACIVMKDDGMIFRINDEVRLFDMHGVGSFSTPINSIVGRDSTQPEWARCAPSSERHMVVCFIQWIHVT